MEYATAHSLRSLHAIYDFETTLCCDFGGRRPRSSFSVFLFIPKYVAKREGTAAGYCLFSLL
jgi:hypothetical protein